MKILSLCDYTGNMVKPWAHAGHDCYIVDIQHPEGEREFSANIVSLGLDLVNQEFRLMDFDMVFAAPPMY